VPFHCSLFSKGDEKAMLMRWLLAALHLLPLGLGLGAVWWRGVSLRGPLDRVGLQRVFLADTLWGIAAALWILTGLMRAFGGYEKGTDYYLHNGAFLIKMILFVLIFILEIWPMTTLIQWRIRQNRQTLTDTSAANALARISWIQAGLVIVMIFAATAMARGLGAGMW
jgi:putative membrane protein